MTVKVFDISLINFQILGFYFGAIHHSGNTFLGAQLFDTCPLC